MKLYSTITLDDVEQIEKDNRLQTAIDVVREQFGFLAIQKGTVLTEGSRNIEVAVSTIPCKNLSSISISLHPLLRISENCTVFFSCFILIPPIHPRNDHR